MTAREDIVAALPEYEIGDELGRGGFGLVLAGFHRQLRRAVAIKELPPALAADPRVRARFAAEARVLASLSHPHIVPIYDYVERDGVCLLVMEKLTGGTLWDQFKMQGLGVETTCAVAMAACTALHYAHQRGVLHRDVKPENLLYSGEGVLKITDFGIAKVVGGGETLATRGGEILGTPAYMAPEQAEGRELGPEADVYATGIMLYELLSGQLPFSEEGGALAIVYRHVYEQPIPLGQVAPSIEPALAAVTMRSIARSPGDRFPSAEAFGVAIGEAVTPSWGPAWLGRAGMQIVDAGPISESAKRPTGSGTASTPSVVTPPRPPAASGRTPGGAPPTVGPPPARAPATVGPVSGGSLPQPVPGGTTIVRPQLVDHVVGGAKESDISGAELVPVRQVIELPAPPYAVGATALILFLVAIALALIGIGKTTSARGLQPGMATVAGVDPTRTSTIKVDFSKPIPVQLTALPANVTGVQLGFSVAGISLPPSTTEPLSHNGNVFEAAVNASTDRYLAGGTVTGDLRLIGGTTTMSHQQFLARSKQSAFLTVPGVLVIGLFLFLVAYMESLLRPLRRGRRGVSGVIGMAFLGAGLGATIVGLMWLLGSPEPTVTTVVLCALCGSGAAIATSLAAIRIAQRARIRPRKGAASRAR
ncbi:MAG: protein kinase [Actinomycetota bacterium]|nr:protein kinase [Actinomycetota bacterium]